VGIVLSACPIQSQPSLSGPISGTLRLPVSRCYTWARRRMISSGLSQSGRRAGIPNYDMPTVVFIHRSATYIVPAWTLVASLESWSSHLAPTIVATVVATIVVTVVAYDLALVFSSYFWLGHPVCTSKSRFKDDATPSVHLF
jgi:hypothetical protein